MHEGGPRSRSRGSLKPHSGPCWAGLQLKQLRGRCDWVVSCNWKRERTRRTVTKRGRQYKATCIQDGSLSARLPSDYLAGLQGEARQASRETCTRGCHAIGTGQVELRGRSILGAFVRLVDRRDIRHGHLAWRAGCHVLCAVWGCGMQPCWEGNTTPQQASKQAWLACSLPAPSWSVFSFAGCESGGCV